LLIALPLRAQLATITSTKTNRVLSQKQDYIASLEQIHAESLASATEAEKRVYQQAKDLLGS
jgi:ABC-type branched-subunit amino acid transport system substrate-binding protein